MRAIFRVIFDHFAMTYGVEYPLKVQIVILGFFICMMGNAIIPGVYRPDDVLDIHPRVSIKPDLTRFFRRWRKPFPPDLITK